MTQQQADFAARFVPDARKSAAKLTEELRRRGVNADPDQLESDATLFLLKAAEKYETQVNKRTEAYFKKGLSNWAGNRFSNARRDHRVAQARVQQLPDGFDTSDPETDRRESEQQLLMDCPYPDVVRMLVVERLSLHAVGEAVGRVRLKRLILPAIAEYLGADYAAEKGVG